ncbi:hypothetical protein FRC11_011182 [Ceratobasidium sp. 423]|nr:hypothetical protein FRC11_011182 [Ceratobasidium sp. 423]
MAALAQEDVPAPVNPEEDIRVLPQSGHHFCRGGKCYLLTYSHYVKSEDVGGTTQYDTIKELIDHLYTLQGGGGSLLEGWVDSGGFPPLAAYQYLKKEQAAWEACYRNLIEEFLQEQNPN